VVVAVCYWSQAEIYIVARALPLLEVMAWVYIHNFNVVIVSCYRFVSLGKEPVGVALKSLDIPDDVGVHRAVAPLLAQHDRLGGEVAADVANPIASGFALDLFTGDRAGWYGALDGDLAIL
jgi:hypothetical protein